MAERIEHEWGRKSTGGGPTKYPYDEWLDGYTWLLKRGEDFDSQLNTMLELLKHQASKRNRYLRYELDTEAETITINARSQDDD